MFDDFFKLRENLYDAARLQRLARPELIEETWSRLKALPTKRRAPAYRWSKRPLSAAMREWQLVMSQAVELDPLARLSPLAQGWASRLQQVNLADLPLEVLAELAQHAPKLYRRLRVGLIP